MSKRYFEFSEGSSNKFWEVWTEGNKVLTRYGKIGAAGQTTVKDEGSPAGAQKLHDKLVGEKTKKGYAEKGGGGAAAAPAAAPAPAKVAVKKAPAPTPPPAPAKAAAPAAVEPGFRRFEFVEGSSSKFWEVKVEGEQQIVRFGKIGTAGQTKEKDFESAGEAKADTKKLIAEKTGKGYAEVGVKKVPSNPALEAAIAANPDDGKNWRVFADWLLEQGEPWAEMIALAVQGKPNKKKQGDVAKELLGSIEGDIVWKNGVIAEFDLQPDDVEEEGAMEAALERVLKHPAGRFVQKLTLGLPPHEDLEWHMEGLASVISDCGPLPLLQTLDMSPNAEHMDQESWRRVGDISGLWAAAPHLKELLLRGSAGSDDGEAIDFGDIEAPHLEKLIFISGGLNKNAPTQIGSAKLPKLTHLELYFGKEDYGCSSTVASLKGILEGSGLPALKTLGLKNSEWEEDLIKAICASKILPRLEALDLSMGVLADKGAAALIANAPKFKHLKKLILSDNYFSTSDAGLLKKALPNAEVGKQKADEDPEYRYTSIAE
ncbi:MAG: WGR domain-containing protein [Archangium sp.]|nr:WGR domain-containing protein [Archangium sp.]